MVLFVAILFGILSLALAGKSPHADLVEELIRSPDGSRYSTNILEDALLDVPGLITKYRYPVETHDVITSDGYILGLHRIPYGRDQSSTSGNRPVVFLMHGLLSSSADFVIMGPGNAMAYMLADEGYDVWMGNARGSFYSRRHITLDPDDRQNTTFWRFSWDEIGNYDLPASIDYVLEKTGQSKVHYVGHSQGGATFLVMASLRPEYNEKIISYHGLAPAAFFTHNEFRPIVAVSPYEKILETIIFRFGSGEFLGRSNLFVYGALGGSYICGAVSFLQPLCSGFSNDGINMTMFPAHLGHTPAGISVRQLTHFGQNINDKGFRRFDFGLLGNWARYQQFTPPDYDLSRVTTPTYLHYTLNDVFVHYDDVYQLAASLPNMVALLQISNPAFSHLDFIWGIDAKDVLNGQLLDAIRDAESRF